MNTKFDFVDVQADRIVYVRPVTVADLPADVQARAGGLETIWAVHGKDGERLALVGDRKMAFILARQNDFLPVSAH
ncbi:MAG: DUF1150 family protein [Albidovulum sp.]|jgi:hypothetical protein